MGRLPSGANIVVVFVLAALFAPPAHAESATKTQAQGLEEHLRADARCASKAAQNAALTTGRFAIDPLETAPWDWISIYDAEARVLDALPSLAERSAVTLRDGCLVVLGVGTDALSPWLAVDLRAYLAEPLQDFDSSSGRTEAKNGRVYVSLNRAADGLLLVFDLLTGDVSRLSSKGLEILRGGLRNRGATTWEMAPMRWPGSGPIADLSILDRGARSYTALARPSTGVVLIDWSNKTVAVIPVPSGSRFDSVELSESGDLYVVDRGEQSGDRILVKYDAIEGDVLMTGSQQFDLAYGPPGTGQREGTRETLSILPTTAITGLHVESDSPADAGRKVYFASGCGVFVIQDPGHGREHPSLEFVSGNTKTEKLQFSMRGQLQTSCGGPKRVGFAGWSDQNYLLLTEPHTDLTAFTAGAWVYLARPEATGDLLFDHNHDERVGWASGFSEGSFFTYVGRRRRSVSSPTLTPGEWRHVVVVNNGSRLTILLDGRSVAANFGSTAVKSAGLAIGRGVTVTGRHLNRDTWVFLPFISRNALPVDVIRRIYETEQRYLRHGFVLARTDLASYLRMAVRPLTIVERTSRFALNLSKAVRANASTFLREVVLDAKTFILLAAFALFVLGYQTESRASYILVFCFVAVASLVAYLRGGAFSHPFRSDNYIAFNLFSTLTWSPEDLLKASRFEMFGHRRVHPLAHLIMFLQYKVLGMQHVAHHVFQFVLHVISASLLFFFVARLTGKIVAGLIAGSLFLALYSQFDMINWTYHSFVVISTILVLTALILVQLYVERQNRWLLAASFVFLFAAQMVYEANALMTGGAGLFFVALLYKRRGDVRPGETRRSVKTFVVGLSIMYSVYGIVVAHEALRTTPVEGAEGAGAVRMSDLLMPRNLLAALSDTVEFVTDPLLAKAAGFPSGLVIKDIVYQTSVGPSYGPVAFVVAAMVAGVLLLSLRPRRDDVPVIVVFTATLLVFVYIVALGRSISAPPDYVRSQSHYAYFPNLLLSIVLALLLRPRLERHRFVGLVTGAAILVALTLNLHQIEAGTRKTTEHLAELASFVATVDEFQLARDSRREDRVFVEFPVGQRNYSFNLGTDIALEKYFEGTGVLTKEVRKARYVYDRELGIGENPRYAPNASRRSEFTIEFVAQKHRPRFTKDFTVVGSLDQGLSIGFTAEGKLFVQAPNHGMSGGSFRRFISTYEFSNFNFYHVVVQASQGSLYVIVNGNVEDMFKGVTVNCEQMYRGTSVLGDFYSGAEEVFFATALYVRLGDALYDTRGVTLGDYIPVEWQPPWINVQKVDY